MEIYTVHEFDLFWKRDSEYLTSTRTMSIENYLEEIPYSNDVLVKNNITVNCIRGLIVKPNNVSDIIEVRNKWYKCKNLSDWYYYSETEVLQAIKNDDLVFINGLGEVDKDNLEVIKENFNKFKV
ncbi:hypothetical protein COO16_04005 [Bacillus pseudomycoides]|uniref:hypothetical protein n=1 Tax=Bacillus pseudomycoides TaxID=64104 RepID=UPI000BEB4300|nr:hypothetical protein [Bacillus pseudomycoides]PDY14135.1 hypothetical protein COO16_04005 [Bacillus pseudomycoides]